MSGDARRSRYWVRSATTFRTRRAVGVDHILFGSDYPHPEGMSDPISYVDELSGFSDDEIARIMGGNLADLLGVDAATKLV